MGASAPWKRQGFQWVAYVSDLQRIGESKGMHKKNQGSPVWWLVPGSDNVIAKQRESFPHADYILVLADREYTDAWYTTKIPHLNCWNKILQEKWR